MKEISFSNNLSIPEQKIDSAYWFIFNKQKLLILTENNLKFIPYLESLEKFSFNIIAKQYLGTLDNKHCFAVEVEDEIINMENYSFYDLRMLFSILDQEVFQIAKKAMHLLSWDIENKFCSKCSGKLEFSSNEISKICKNCQATYYPKISPAIIVAVIKDNKILLARAKHFSTGRFSVLAGYVEPGETLEQCVKREVKEEVNIDVKNIKYFSNQDWSFSNALMIGFTAEYAGGEIKVDDKEIAEADWFSVNNLPEFPGKISISYQLIEWFRKNNK